MIPVLFVNEGKSTILNGLIGAIKFLSGFSAGKGMTESLQLHEHTDGIIYGDTPVNSPLFSTLTFPVFTLEILSLFVKIKGLSDVKLRKKAAKSITKALRSDGRFKLIFVATVEAGRVRPDDVTTINLVLDAINHPVEYGVIVNKVTRKFVLKVTNSEENFNAIFGGFNTGERKTDHFFYMEKKEELDDEDNKLAVMPEDLRNFIYNTVPDTIIFKEHVSEVKTDEFERMKEKFAAEIEEIKQNSLKREEAFQQTIAALERDREVMAKQREEQDRKFKEDYDKMQAELQRERDNHRAEMQRKLDEFQQQISQANESNKQALDQQKREYEARMQQIENDNAAKQQKMQQQITELQKRPAPSGGGGGGGWCSIF